MDPKRLTQLGVPVGIVLIVLGVVIDVGMLGGSGRGVARNR